mgnify:CR=1 FL=1|tara:strand:+ start:329 stop:625 length:297 start_codon:yes stop_codon:yes gene_type:complete
MLENIFNTVSNNSTLLIGTGATGAILWVLKKVPNEEIADKVEYGCEKLGTFLTLGLSSWKVTKKVWNKTIEPWFIDLVDNIVGAGVRGFIKGLRSDNK